ncbi:hypothetical protein [Parashewanella curva]|nr:hypothetical protein [Parashewanella curva]
MKATLCMGMVNIDSDKIAYANIKDMYKHGNGSGLQLDRYVTDEQRDKIHSLCCSIAEKMYELEAELNNQ